MGAGIVDMMDKSLESTELNLEALARIDKACMEFEQQLKAGNLAPLIFGLAFLFVYLFLVAQYESWMIPLAVLFGVPVAYAPYFRFAVHISIETLTLAVFQYSDAAWFTKVNPSRQFPDT